MGGYLDLLMQSVGVRGCYCATEGGRCGVTGLMSMSGRQRYAQTAAFGQKLSLNRCLSVFTADGSPGIFRST